MSTSSTLAVRPQRLKIFQLGELRVGSRTLRVHVLDISRGGARLHCPLPTEPGSPVILRWETHFWRGVIAWSAGDKCGIRFHVPLCADVISAITAPNCSPLATP